jgi:putative salt-induced outer membrane protein YdiY
MKLYKIITAVAVILTGVILSASAQSETTTVTNIVTTTVTNIVTMTVTNIVTVTNVIDKVIVPVAVPVPVPVATAVATNAIIKYPWKSSITAGLTLTRGNSHTLLATAKFLTDKKTPVNEYNWGADVTYGSSDGVENNDTYHGFGQWNHLFSEKWYGYLRGEGLHDGIAEVKYRFTVTSGVGYYFIKKADTTLSAEVGPGVVTQRLGDESTTYATMRLAEKGEHKFNNGKARVWESVELLPQLDKPSDYLMNAELGVESALSKSLSLSVVLDDNYNSQPAAGFKRNDVKLVSGVTYNF